MRHRNSALLLLVSMISIFCGLPIIAQGQQESIWRHDFAKAEAEAKAKELPMLVHFYGDGCPPCEAMERNVLNTDELRDQLKGKVIPVKINGNRNIALRQRFGVNSWPQDFFVLPDGQTIWQNKGGMSKTNYLNALAGTQNKWSNILRIHIAQKAASDKKKKKMQIAKVKSSYLEEKDEKTNGVNTSKKPVGLRGYSPVSLILNQKWVKGNSEITAVSRGIVFRFASEEEKKQFEETPRFLSPQLLGCDPVVMLNTDRAIPGAIKYCTFFDERLYVFVSEQSRKEFKLEPMKYISQRHVMLQVLKLDQVERF